VESRLDSLTYMLATFVIFLREGIEASMIVAILLAYLDKIGQRRHFRDIFLGCGLAILLATGAGVAAYLTVRTYAGSRVQTIFETCTYLLAAVVLTYMTFWMRGHARTISKELRERTERALERGERFGLGFLAFQAVGREGLETAVFTLAIVFAAGSNSHYLVFGGVLGLIAALAVAFSIYRLGRRINMGRFFAVLGAVLTVFAAGLLADATENLQQLGLVNVLTHQLWNTSGALSESSALGDVFHSLFGYADRPTVLQAIVYLGFLVLVLSGFRVMSKRQSSRAVASPDGSSRAPAPGTPPAASPVAVPTPRRRLRHPGTLAR
jgi:high-affinity iron transporter